MMFLGSILAGRCSDATIGACAPTFPFQGEKNPNHETLPQVSGALRMTPGSPGFRLR